MTVNNKNSNTLAVSFCGNLERPLRHLSNLAFPLTIYRGPHSAVYPMLQELMNNIQQQFPVF